MERSSLLFLLLLTMCFCAGQNRTFVYQLTYKPGVSKDSIAKTLFVLDIAGQKSLFRTLEEKQSDSSFIANKSTAFMTTSFDDNLTVEKDLTTKTSRKYITSFSKMFGIKIDEPLKWRITDETKTVMGMKMQKATTSYGGRKWDAWFTPEIPLQDGPYVFNGLPGLIAEIRDAEDDYHFLLVQIKNSDGKLYLRENVLPISWKQYEKLAMDYYADPTREINGKNAGTNPMFMIKWFDDSGVEYAPNFKEMNDNRRRVIRENNNPIELNRRLDYK
ncbi:GLPGLI family protein [Kaistella palustris]|uniref:GLPGLI family protein n=1 Tax=Kaistella palustris TaxID=493376 RepID=UPI0012EBD9D4|nr:GLPGLI family protein [Kaistella palustris]